jgi:hypothetical protein
MSQSYRFTKLLVLAVLSILTVRASHATDRNCRAYDGVDLPESEVALLTFGRSRDSNLYLFDGELVSLSGKCNIYKIELLPGEHTIHFSYLLSSSVLGPSGGDPASFTFVAEPGHVYDLVVEKAKSFAWKYICRIEDVSTQEVVVEKEDCETGKGEAWLEIQRAEALCGDMDAVVELVRWKAGMGDNMDPVEAYFWCSLVEETYSWGDPFQCKSFLFDKISKEQIQEAEQRLSSWPLEVCTPNMY